MGECHRQLPRWDAALAAVKVGDLPAYPRYDLRHVANPAERPTGVDYDRYLWLVKRIKKAGCDERSIYRSHLFLVKDVLFSAILAAANELCWRLPRWSRHKAETIP